MGETKDSGLEADLIAEFELAGLESPSRERELRDKLERMDGVTSLVVSEGKATVHYDATKTSAKKIEAAIGEANLKICESEVGQASPLPNLLNESQRNPSAQPPAEQDSA